MWADFFGPAGDTRWNQARLIELSASKTDWPWAEESPQLPDNMPGDSIDRLRPCSGQAGQMAPWPRVSIVTPSYNQAAYIEATIRSVLLQGYPNLEYIVMDGGSTDGSVDIIRKYEPYLAYWTSGSDRGQADALSKGFERATGQILGFVNSDDILLPDALLAVARFLMRHTTVHLVVGKSLLVDSDGRTIMPVMGLPPSFHSLLFSGCRGFKQPATFWSREAFFEVGGLDTSFPLTFDFEFFLRLVRKYSAHRINQYVAAFRIHPQSVTSTKQDAIFIEHQRVLRHHGLDSYSRLIRALAPLYYRCRYRLLAGIFRLLVVLGLEKVPRMG